MKGEKMRFRGKFVAGAILTAVMAMGLGACTQTGSGDEPVLNFEVEETLIAEVGEYFEIPSPVCTDEEGNRYFADVDVYDEDGENVLVEDGKFFVLSVGDYVLKYSVDFNGEIIRKETKVQAKDTTLPVIELISTETYELQGSIFEIPEAHYSDNYTAAEELIVETEVVFEETAVEVNDGAFELTNAGEYTIVYTAADSSGNKAEALFTVNSVAKETDNITYFNQSFGAESLAEYSTNLGEVGKVEESREKTVPGDEYVLKYTVPAGGAASGLGGFYVQTPFVKDVSDYEYLYFYVYTEQSDVGLTFNSTYSTNRLTPGIWTKIILTRDEDGKNYTTPWGTKVFEVNGAVTPKDITNFQYLLYLPEGETTIYMTAMRGAHEMPRAEVEMDDIFAKDTEITLPEAMIDGEKYETKVYLFENGILTEIEAGKYTFEKEGNHTFVFEVIKDGKLADIVQKTVLCFTEEVGNISYFNYAFGAERVRVSPAGEIESTREKTIPGEEYALKYEVVPGVTWSGIYLSDPYITDISVYKYLYFYVYTEQSGVGVTFNEVYSTNRLVPGMWTKIVLTRDEDGKNYTTPWGTKVFQEGGTAVPSDIKDFQLYLYLPDSGAVVYFSAMRGTNEMPRAEISMDGIYERNTEISVPKVSMTGVADLTQNVYTIYKGIVSPVVGDKYTFIKEGQYRFVFEVISNGKLVDVISQTAVCYEREDGNVTYFNKSYGADFLEAYNQYGHLSVSKDKTIEGDEYSLRYDGDAGAPAGGFYLRNPFIKDISVYKYLYFYVYTEQSDVGVTFNGEWSPNRLTPGTWTKVVLTRNADGSNYTTPWGTNVFGAGGSAAPQDMTDFQYYLYVPANTACTIYFSTLRGTNELPV